MIISINVNLFFLFFFHPDAGLYAGSKSAFATVSESLRLEMRPLGVRVVTVNVGAVATNIFNNRPVYAPPPDSVYGPVEKQIEARVTGSDVSGSKDTPEVFARGLVGKILGGASGKVSSGKLSSTVRVCTTYLPTWLMVSLPMFLFLLVHHSPSTPFDSLTTIANVRFGRTALAL